MQLTNCYIKLQFSGQTSGYWSVTSSTRSDDQPDSHHTVACRRDSVASQDEGSINSMIQHSTTPMTTPGEQNEIEQVNVCMGTTLEVVTFAF